MGKTLSGQADVAFALFYTGSGGVSMGGTASNQVSNDYVASGGISISGQADLQTTYVQDGSGGITTGGQADVKMGFSTSSLGSVTISGQATALVQLVRTGSGGATTGGQAVVTVQLNYTMTGGITMGGQAISPNLGIHYTASGGLSLGGGAKALPGLHYTTSGGVVTGGQCGNGLGLQVGYNYNPRYPHNRIFIYGRANYGRNSYDYTMDGGVSISGQANTELCSVSCDVADAFYRQYEARTGCKVVLANGKTDYICARAIAYLPTENTPRSNLKSALVPATTVCRQGLTSDSKGTKKYCGQLIRK